MDQILLEGHNVTYDDIFILEFNFDFLSLVAL